MMDSDAGGPITQCVTAARWVVVAMLTCCYISVESRDEYSRRQLCRLHCVTLTFNISMHSSAHHQFNWTVNRHLSLGFTKPNNSQPVIYRGADQYYIRHPDRLYETLTDDWHIGFHVAILIWLIANQYESVLPSAWYDMRQCFKN